jgi:hypothetical protein
VKALISPKENNRILEVNNNDFPVAYPLFWVECPDICNTNWIYTATGEFKAPIIKEVNTLSLLEKLESIRQTRGDLLKGSDWTQLIDVQKNKSEEWKHSWQNYRSQLRDLLSDPYLNVDDPIYPLRPDE